MTPAPLQTPAEIRAVLGAKADRLTDADLDAIARRLRVISVAVLAQMKGSDATR